MIHVLDSYITSFVGQDVQQINGIMGRWNIRQWPTRKTTRRRRRCCRCDHHHEETITYILLWQSWPRRLLRTQLVSRWLILVWVRYTSPNNAKNRTETNSSEVPSKNDCFDEETRRQCVVNSARETLAASMWKKPVPLREWICFCSAEAVMITEIVLTAMLVNVAVILLVFLLDLSGDRVCNTIFQTLEKDTRTDQDSPGTWDKAVRQRPRLFASFFWQLHIFDESSRINHHRQFRWTWKQWHIMCSGRVEDMCQQI